MNDVEWDHVVEEIEDAGLSQLNVVRSGLRQTLAHLLQLHGWPDSDTRDQWRNEVATFQVDAIARYAPSMRQRIDLPKAYMLAHRQIAPMRQGDHPACPLACPVAREQRLTASDEDLEVAFISR